MFFQSLLMSQPRHRLMLMTLLPISLLLTRLATGRTKLAQMQVFPHLVLSIIFMNILQIHLPKRMSGSTESTMESSTTALTWTEKFGLIFFIIAVVFVLLFAMATVCCIRTNQRRKAADVQADIAETNLVKYVRSKTRFICYYFHKYVRQRLQKNREGPPNLSEPPPFSLKHEEEDHTQDSVAEKAGSRDALQQSSALSGSSETNTDSLISSQIKCATNKWENKIACSDRSAGDE